MRWCQLYPGRHQRSPGSQWCLWHILFYKLWRDRIVSDSSSKTQCNSDFQWPLRQKVPVLQEFIVGSGSGKVTHCGLVWVTLLLCGRPSPWPYWSWIPHPRAALTSQQRGVNVPEATLRGEATLGGIILNFLSVQLQDTHDEDIFSVLSFICSTSSLPQRCFLASFLE